MWAYTVMCCLTIGLCSEKRIVSDFAIVCEYHRVHLHKPRWPTTHPGYRYNTIVYVVCPWLKCCYAAHDCIIYATLEVFGLILKLYNIINTNMLVLNTLSLQENFCLQQFLLFSKKIKVGNELRMTF